MRTIDRLKDYLRRRIGGYKVAIKDVPTTNRVYRGRVCKERPDLVEELSYPPPEKVKRLGRANREGKPMFYCSLGAFPVFFEIHAREGEFVALSEWALTEPLWMHNLGYHPDALGRMGAGVSDNRIPLLNPVPNETNRNNRLRRRMSLAFTQEVPKGAEYRYKETIAITELLFDGASPVPNHGPGAPKCEYVAGIVYPAVQMRGLADNIAMLPDFTDRYVMIKSVRYLRVEAADREKVSYTFLTLARADSFAGNTIVWSKDQVPEAERRSHVTFDDGHWIFRDGFGRVYGVH